MREHEVGDLSDAHHVGINVPPREQQRHQKLQQGHLLLVGQYGRPVKLLQARYAFEESRRTRNQAPRLCTRSRAIRFGRRGARNVANFDQAMKSDCREPVTAMPVMLPCPTTPTMSKRRCFAFASPRSRIISLKGRHANVDAGALWYDLGDRVQVAGSGDPLGGEPGRVAFQIPAATVSVGRRAQSLPPFECHASPRAVGDMTASLQLRQLAQIVGLDAGHGPSAGNALRGSRRQQTPPHRCCHCGRSSLYAVTKLTPRRIAFRYSRREERSGAPKASPLSRLASSSTMAPYPWLACLTPVIA